MNLFNRFSISKKIFIIPIIGSLTFLLYLSLATVTANKSVDTLSAAKDIQFPVVQYSKDVSILIEKISELLNSAVTTGDEESIETADELATEVIYLINKIGSTDQRFQTIQKKILSEFEQYYQQGKGLSLGMVNETIDFTDLPKRGKQMNNSFEAVISTVKRFNSAQVEEFSQAIINANISAQSLVSIGFIMGGVTIVLLFGSALPIAKGITLSVNEVVKSLKDLAEGEGDLTVRLHAKTQDEVGFLIHSFNLFMNKLQTTIKQVVEIATPLSDMAISVSATAVETNQITQDQQLGVNNTKDAVENMSQSVQSIADSASLASSASNDAAEVSLEGIVIIERTVKTINLLSKTVENSSFVINKLDDDTKQVAAVLDVIKSIADQTNLLALNAAIEAARAGEQGRGFAVVADEVRTLASRTQDSTTQIQATIEKLQVAARSAVNAMSEGKALAEQSVKEVSQAGKQLAAISTSVSQINEMTGEIANTTNDQSRVSQQIVSHIDEIKESTTSTSQSSDELAEVSSNLANLANNLQTLTQNFKV